MAKEQFAERGYARTTTRSVAAAVGVDPALVTRYFGSKAQLFGEVVDLDLTLPDLVGADRGLLGRTVVGTVLDAWESGPALPALLRTAPTSPDAAALLTAALAERGSAAFAQVTPDRVEARTALVVAQFVGFAFVRHILQTPAVVAMSRDEVVAWLAPTVARLLLDPLDDDPTDGDGHPATESAA